MSADLLWKTSPCQVLLNIPVDVRAQPRRIWLGHMCHESLIFHWRRIVIRCLTLKNIIHVYIYIYYHIFVHNITHTYIYIYILSYVILYICQYISYIYIYMHMYQYISLHIIIHHYTHNIYICNCIYLCQSYPHSKDPQRGIDDTQRQHVLRYVIVQFAADLVVSKTLFQFLSGWFPCKRSRLVAVFAFKCTGYTHDDKWHGDRPGDQYRTAIRHSIRGTGKKRTIWPLRICVCVYVYSCIYIYLYIYIHIYRLYNSI